MPPKNRYKHLKCYNLEILSETPSWISTHSFDAIKYTPKKSTQSGRVKSLGEHSTTSIPLPSKVLLLCTAACVRTGTTAFHARSSRIITAVPYIETCGKCVIRIITVFKSQRNNLTEHPPTRQANPIMLRSESEFWALPKCLSGFKIK